MSATDHISIQVPKNIIAGIIMERLNSIGVSPATAQPSALPPIGTAWEGGIWIYAGLTIHDNAPRALVLLPGDFSGDWQTALDWAEKENGELPSRIDALVLFKNLKDQFKPEWYWTNEQPASDESYAWLQHFGSGGQTYGHEVNDLRARAVRRLPI